jgi:protein arginine N-methyltransferase 1
MRRLEAGHAEYSLRHYGDMIADRVRMNAYRRALARVVKPGAVVLDLGAGTGIMALLACRLGAARVYAVEPSDAIAVGIELARANGCADRITFLQEPSLDVALPRRADVVVSDLRGILPLHGLHIPSIVDARRRLLAPGGVLVPRRDVVRAQLVCAPALHAGNQRPWSEAPFGLDLTPALKWAAHQWRKADLSGLRRIGRPATLFEIDYRTIESPDARGEAQWRAPGAATVHGLGVWFDTVLADGVGFSNAPDRPRAIYGQALFPFTQPLRLSRGDRVRVRVAANLVAGNYVWQWHTSVTAADGRTRAELRQSSFQGMPVSPGRLQRHAEET